jgi:hypothetical protein
MDPVWEVEAKSAPSGEPMCTSTTDLPSVVHVRVVLPVLPSHTLMGFGLAVSDPTAVVSLSGSAGLELELAWLLLGCGCDGGFAHPKNA